MNWLTRLKKTQVDPKGDATNATETLFVVSVASIPAPIQKIEALSPAANDPASSKPDALENLRKPEIAAPEPPTDPNAWRELATAYHLHHFKCGTCIAAGRGAQYGLRCGTGTALLNANQDT